MLDSYKQGYAVMSKNLDAYSFESTDIDACKRYCRNGDVITEMIPYIFGWSIRIVWHKYWHRFIRFSNRSREFNIFYLHINWNAQYTHRIGKIVHESKQANAIEFNKLR